VAGGRAGAQPALAIVTPPTLTMDPNGLAPLAGVVEAETNVPARATLAVTGATESWTVQLPEYATDQYLPVLGLVPDSTYTVTVTFTDAAGTSVVSNPPLQAVTPPLPADFPEILVSVSQPEKMEPGYTLLDRVTGTDYQIIVDADGDVVWYSTVAGRDTVRLLNGHLRWRSNTSIWEFDLLGNQEPSIALGAANLHHEFFRTAYGAYLSLSREIITVNDYPTSDTDPAAPTQTAQIEADVMVEFGLDGALLDSWSLADIIDPTRIGYMSLDADESGVYDWSHSNAIIHDHRDDSIIVSVRHQDAVIKFSRATGELVWILGPHDNWKPEYQPFLLQPVGPLSWQYHQHAMMITPFGTLLMFDNGNFRASPFDGNPVLSGPSRAVEYAIDEDNMEVSQVWEYGAESPADALFSGALSDADWMTQTGNVLIDFGNVASVNGVPSDDLGLGSNHTRIIEVTRGTPAEVVFDMTLYAPGARRSVYRVERIPSLYPSSASGPFVASVPTLGVPQLALLGLLLAAIGAARQRSRPAKPSPG
jgi:arylsulfate sulfotransferase